MVTNSCKSGIVRKVQFYFILIFGRLFISHNAYKSMQTIVRFSTHIHLIWFEVFILFARVSYRLENIMKFQNGRKNQFLRYSVNRFLTLSNAKLVLWGYYNSFNRLCSRQIYLYITLLYLFFIVLINILSYIKATVKSTTIQQWIQNGINEFDLTG